MTGTDKTELQAIADRYPDDEEIISLVTRLAKAEALLDRSLYEFGSELRNDIEKFLGQPHLIPPPGAH